jgi:hypothetical protein
VKQILIFGRRFQGKTTIALHLALQGTKGVAVYDINAQIARFPESTTSDLGVLDNWLDSSGHRVVVFRPQTDVWSEFDFFAGSLWRKRGFCLFIDEASQLQTSGHCHPWLDRFVRMASRQDVDIIQTMHRPRDAATLCRSLATDWYIFRTTQETDLEVIAEHCGSDIAEQVRNVGEGSHHAVHWDDAVARGEILTDPAAWFESLK